MDQGVSLYTARPFIRTAQVMPSHVAIRQERPTMDDEEEVYEIAQSFVAVYSMFIRHFVSGLVFDGHVQLHQTNVFYVHFLNFVQTHTQQKYIGMTLCLFVLPRLSRSAVNEECEVDKRVMCLDVGDLDEQQFGRS